LQRSYRHFLEILWILYIFGHYFFSAQESRLDEIVRKAAGSTFFCPMNNDVRTEKTPFLGLFPSIFGWSGMDFPLAKGVLRFYFSSIRTTSKLFACNDFCNLTSILDRITLPSDHQREAFACSI